MTLKRKSSRQKMIISAVTVGILAITCVVGASQIVKIREFFSRASGQPANLTVNVASSTDFSSKTWQNLAQGGESATFSLKPFTGELKQLAPKYIRIDHLYDFYIKVSRGGDGKLQYDFSKLDNIIAEMRTVNALPFLSLSYMPDVLSGDITGPPTNWDDYYLVVKNTIEHVSGKRGLNLKDVYYEVWNEPDLFGQWKTYGDKNYLFLYKTASNAANAATNTLPFHFGGPATTALYDNWTTNMMDAVQNQNLRMDFFSWHHYTAEPEDFRQDIERLRAVMKPYQAKANDLEMIISEWGINSENDARYDSNAAAAHLISSLTYMMPVIDKAFIFEIEDGKNPEGKEKWGRWGLYANAEFGIKAKPRAQAIKLLNLLGSEKLPLSGSGSWVRAIAAKKDKTIQVLITNYDRASIHSETTPLTLQGLTTGTYQFATTFLGRAKTTQTINVEGNTYSTTIPLPPNSVALLEFTPQ